MTPALSKIDFHCPLGVNGETDVGIDGNAEQARVGVDELVLVPNNRVPQHAGVIQVSEASHVIRTVKLGRIYLPNLILLVHFFLFCLQDGDGDLVPIGGIDETLKVSMSSLVWDPAGLL